MTKNSEKERNMEESKKQLVKLIYGIVTTVAVAVLGICFILACYGIYSSGPNAFTRESVGAALMSIIVPIIIAVVLIIGGLVLSLVLRTEMPPAKAFVTNEVMEQRLLAARDLDYDSVITANIERERRLRSVFGLINGAVFIAGAVFALIYALNPLNYNDNLNESVIKLVIHTVNPLLPAFLLLAARLIINELSFRRERELLMSLPRLAQPTPVSQKVGIFDRISAFLSRHERPITLGVRIAVVAMGVLYVILGTLNGGMSDVLQKAIKICTECIGLG